MSAADVWPIVKARLELLDDARKPLIETYIAEIEHRMKHYCNIRALPDNLLYVWASMTVDAVRVDLPNADEIADTVGGGANIKVGDTSVSGGSSGSGVTNTSKAVIDQVVLDYRVDLNRYRQMRWGG
ncbi:DNA-packaging protein [Paenibacillus sp. MAHUQ-46]|uniref:DNA-packaging protein n=1 Tax=Paenibacillus roseus TaxID=2798579 RepID=A0A934J5V0_9BACL|nr:DNA-packaging protein [Paenibacillus roseus]